MKESSRRLLGALSPDKHGSEEPWRSPTQDRESPSQGVEVPVIPDHNPTYKPPGTFQPQNEEFDETHEDLHRTPRQEGRPTTEATLPSDPLEWSMENAAKWLTELTLQTTSRQIS